MADKRDMQWPRDWEAAIPERIKGLIFDCDGTIVDTMPVHYRAWREALSRHGLTFTEERFYEWAGATSPVIVRKLALEQGVMCDAFAVAMEKEALYEASLRDLEPIHSVVAIARREKGKRRLAVASGGRVQAVRASLEVIDVDHLFEVIVGMEDVKHGKPDPELFLIAAAKIGCRPEECVVYEDGDLGIEAAKRAGMEWIDVRPWYLSRG
jgi:HAD superfamily hydrolase (TIGR01509 family)